MLIYSDSGGYGGDLKASVSVCLEICSFKQCLVS